MPGVNPLCAYARFLQNKPTQPPKPKSSAPPRANKSTPPPRGAPQAKVRRGVVLSDDEDE